MTHPLRLQLKRTKGFDRLLGSIGCDMEFLREAIEHGDPHSELADRQPQTHPSPLIPEERYE